MVERINAAMHAIRIATGLRPAPHVAARIARFAHHDPAAVRGIASALSAEQVLGDAVLPDPLPAPRAIRKAVEGIVADIDPASRRLLTVAAHMVSDRTDVLLAAAAVDIAVVLGDRSTDALAFGDGRFRFRDDRLRAVLHQEADATYRKEVHRSLSRASALLPEPRIASWHALQSWAPNAPSPAALLPLAERLLRSGDLHGAFTVAADVAGRASSDARAEAALLAGRAAFALGCLEDATRLLSQAASHGSWARTLLDDVALVRELSHGREADPSTSARAVAAATTGITDARAMGALTRAAVVGEGDPEEADALQAGILLSAIHARAESTWRLSAGPLSPLVEAYARARHIAAQERDGDHDAAARSLRDAVGRLPMTLVVPRPSAQVAGLLVRGTLDGKELTNALTGADAGAPHAPLSGALSTAARSPHSSIAAQVVLAGAVSSERALERPTEPGLSARQQEILDLLLTGKKNQEVGDILGISPRTVEVHVTSLLRKTGARSRVELVAHVLRRAGESRMA